MEFASAIVIQGGKILLLKRSKEEVEKDKWNPPNETIEDPETPEVAIVRGVREEVNYEFEIEKFLFLHYHNNLRTHIFFGKVSGELILEPSEVSEIGWFSYQEAIKLEFAFSYGDAIEKLHELGYF